jgi:hypothetical protein
LCRFAEIGHSGTASAPIPATVPPFSAIALKDSSTLALYGTLFGTVATKPPSRMMLTASGVRLFP